MIVQEYNISWYNSFIQQEHIPAVDADGLIDNSALDYENHNGPRCIRCDYMPCMYCEGEKDIPKCTGVVR